MSNEVFAFEVWAVWKPEWSTIINARTAGKAKYQKWLDILCDKDSIWPDKTIYVHPSDLIR